MSQFSTWFELGSHVNCYEIFHGFLNSKSYETPSRISYSDFILDDYRFLRFVHSIFRCNKRQQDWRCMHCISRCHGILPYLCPLFYSATVFPCMLCRGERGSIHVTYTVRKINFVYQRLSSNYMSTMYSKIYSHIVWSIWKVIFLEV